MSNRPKLALTIDLEDWYHLPPITGAPDSTFGSVEQFFEEWNGRYDYLTAPTERTLNILDAIGVRATFFVVADIVDHYPGLVSEIAKRGHDIACHGLHHACAIDPDTKRPRFEPDEYRERLRTARKKLEQASGQEIAGYRAPNAYVGGWMLDVLEELGFVYDSSVARNSLYNKTDSSLEGVSTNPYVPCKGELRPGGSRHLTELPWPYYDIGGIKLPAGGGPLTRLAPERLLRAGVQQSLQRGTTIFYFHPLDICRESFPVDDSIQRLFWKGRGKRAENCVRDIIKTVGVDRVVGCDELIINGTPLNVGGRDLIQ
jgi:peptidoglycan/xylan/chitin deacetylase (PgdA/CDA1 family)